jgi:acylphosphatase
MAIARVRLIVMGRVQGVFFRHSTVQEAQRLGLVGWVENIPDGSVELEAEGPQEKLEELMAWARRGPPMASVSEVRERWLNPTHQDRTFLLRR